MNSSDIPPYATWEADRLLREGISPVLALEARVASARVVAAHVEAEGWPSHDLRVAITTYEDALAIITAPQRLSDIDAVASER